MEKGRGAAHGRHGNGNGKAQRAMATVAPENDRLLGACRIFLRFRWAIIALFAAALIACLGVIPHVTVNYDIIDYLPADSPSTVALNEMEEAFGAGTPNARLYVEGLDLVAAEELSRTLGELSSVGEVMWLGTSVDLRQPLEIQDDEAIGAWVQDDGFLFQMVVDQARATEAAADVRTAAEDAGATAVALEGFAIDSAYIADTASVEIVYIMGAAVAIVFLILLITSHAWFEPVIYLVVIGVAICMNMGTNIIGGQISFVSQICGAVLQLAVSMDYAIVLFHTFRRCEQQFPDPVEAMAQAMRRGFSVVFSSAAVTFFGFLSLTVMRFGIGSDMGVVLAKGIVLSFISVMFLMPCLLLVCRRPLAATEHRFLIPSLAPLARGCARIMTPAAVAIILAAVPSCLAGEHIDFIYGTSNFIQPDSQLGQERDRINGVFDRKETWVLMVPEGRVVDEQNLLDAVRGLPNVTDVTSYLTVAGRAMPTEVVPANQLEQVIDGGWSRMVITADVGPESPDTFQLVESVRALASERFGDDYRLAGTGVTNYDLARTVQEDSGRVKLFTLASIGIVLMIMFRSLSIPAIMLFAIQVSIWYNLAVPYFLGEQMNYTGYLVIDAVQMGAAVDYAIIYAREYFDWRARLGPAGAARAAIEHGGLPILTSACILVFAGLSVGLVSTIGLIADIGMLIARGAFLAMAMMFLLLPWLFKTLDGIIRRTSIGLHLHNGKEATHAEPEPAS